MVDTRRTLSALQTLWADNAGGDISAQDARDGLVSVYGGGMVLNAKTVSAGDVTGIVGQYYRCSIATLSADRNLTLPAGAVDEMIGVHIVDGDASFELIIKGVTGITINDGVAATEWSRLFIAGETVTFRATSATNWDVVQDGRISCKAMIKLTADSGTLTATTKYAWSSIDASGSSELYDTGGIMNATDGRGTIRRTGSYVLSGSFQNSAAGDGRYIIIEKDPDGTPITVFYSYDTGTSSLERRIVSGTSNLTAGDLLEFATGQSTTNWLAKGDANTLETYWSITELL